MKNPHGCPVVRKAAPSLCAESLSPHSPPSSHRCALAAPHTPNPLGRGRAQRASKTPQRRAAERTVFEAPQKQQRRAAERKHAAPRASRGESIWAGGLLGGGGGGERESREERDAEAQPPQPLTAPDPAPVTVLIAAGGTGGHVYPGIAVAEALARKPGGGEEVSVHFAGSERRMEWIAVPKAGFKIHGLPTPSLHRPLLSPLNLLLPLRLALALLHAVHLLLRLRPGAVLGTGGYISVPTCLAAVLLRIPLVLQEQNAVPGLSNRLLALLASAVCCGFAAATRYFPRTICLVTGNPLRHSLVTLFSSSAPQREICEKGSGTGSVPGAVLSTAVEQKLSKQTALNYFFPSTQSTPAPPSPPSLPSSPASPSPPSPPHPSASSSPSTVSPHADAPVVVLVMGGSLGASALNSAVGPTALPLLCAHPALHIVWQTGAAYHAHTARLNLHHPRLCILPFLDRMDLAYTAADVAVCRAGATTCSELLLTATPSILVPSPNVVDDHQARNAEAVVAAGAALLLPESSLSPSSLSRSLLSLLEDKVQLQAMGEAARAAALPNAADDVAALLLRLARKERPPTAAPDPASAAASAKGQGPLLT